MPAQEQWKEQGQEYLGREKREHLGAGQPGVSLIALTLTSKTLSESTEKTKKKKKESKTRLFMGLNSTFIAVSIVPDCVMMR